MITRSDFERASGDPAAFRSALLIDTDSGPIPLVECIDDLLVVLQRRRRVGLALGALTEEVDGGDATLLVEDSDRGDRLIQRIAGYVAAGDLLHNGPRDYGHRVRYGFVHYSHASKPHKTTSIAPDTSPILL